MHIKQAIKELRPGAEWTLSGDAYAGIVWLDGVQTKPTEQEITDYISANSYKENRKVSYPDWRDLADAIYWQEKGDDTKMTAYIAACDAVKSTYPKP